MSRELHGRSRSHRRVPTRVSSTAKLCCASSSVNDFSFSGETNVPSKELAVHASTPEASEQIVLCLSVCLSACFCLCVGLSVHWSVGLSACLSLSVSVCLSLSVSSCPGPSRSVSPKVRVCVCDRSPLFTSSPSLGKQQTLTHCARSNSNDKQYQLQRRSSLIKLLQLDVLRQRLPPRLQVGAGQRRNLVATRSRRLTQTQVTLCGL